MKRFSVWTCVLLGGLSLAISGSLAKIANQQTRTPAGYLGTPRFLGRVIGLGINHPEDFLDVAGHLLKAVFTLDQR
jgi:hypothetical protein